MTRCNVLSVATAMVPQFHLKARPGPHPTVDRALNTQRARTPAPPQARPRVRGLGNCPNQAVTRVNPESRANDLSLLRSHRHLDDDFAP